MFQHNTWANVRVYDACASLSDAQLGATAVGTYGSIRDTLLHLLGAQERYVSLLTGSQLADAPREGAPFPGVAALRERVQANGDALLAVATNADEDAVLRGIWRGEPYAMPIWVPLLQAINHATEHRAHITTILTQQGIQPPAIDGWAFNES